MEGMREIVSMEQADRLFLAIALAAPILCAATAAAIGARRGHALSSARAGLLVGLLGAANYVLWKVYNAITDRLGLDSVKNLLVNLALFVVIGAAAGLAIGYFARRRSASLPETGADPPDP